MFKLYDQHGKMFEISSSDKVRGLLDKGWTPWHPNNPPVLNNPSKVKKQKSNNVRGSDNSTRVYSSGEENRDE